MKTKLILASSLFALLGVAFPQRALSAQGPCSLNRGSNLYLSEGDTDTSLHPPSTGTLPVTVIFVDFPDAPADEDAETLYKSFIPAAVTWYGGASFAKLALTPTPVFKWFRMPLPSATYGFDALTFARQQTYIRDAVTAADPEVNFSGAKAVYIISSRTAKIPVSPTMVGRTGTGVVADGTELRLGVTFGNDVRLARAGYGAFVAVHETLHILGLPDLYSFDGSVYPNYLRFVGGWDLMSWVAPGAHPLAWHSRKLGWLDESQIVCSATGVSTEANLSPLELSGGTKAIVVRLSDAKALVVEYRTQTALDASLCDAGLLVYTVDASVATGQGPVDVVAASEGANSTLLNRCGPKYAAPFDIGAGEIPAYYHSSGLRIELVTRDAAGAQVRLSYPGPRHRAARK